MGNSPFRIANEILSDCGEASGDLHGSNLMLHLRKKDPDATFRCWGGDLMANQGGTLVKHYRDLAFMGFYEVLKNIRTILSNLKFCKKDIEEFQPDVLILIDYPGFNLRIADWAKKNGFRIYYYISPQVWAWKSSRVKKIKANVEAMFVILPFEADFYQKYDYHVNFVGHPLLDVVPDYNASESIRTQLNPSSPVVALLPGSRKQEIKRMLPVMLKVTKAFPDYQFVIAGAPAIPKEFYLDITGDSDQVRLFMNKTYDILSCADAALVTSGTATLETALFNVPEVVCYKGNSLSFQLAKRIVKVKYISLVNLIMDTEVVTELIQDDFTTENLTIELKQLFLPEKRKQMEDAYLLLRKKLGDSGASERTARLMFDRLSNKKTASI